MKYLIATLSITLTTLVGCKENPRYCGVVIEKYRTDAGYKSRPEAHVVFYCESLRRNVDVEVTFNCYANVNVNNNVCFRLSEYDLKK